MKIKNRHILNKKKTQNIENQIKISFQSFRFKEKQKVETGSLDNFEVIIVDEVVCFVLIEGRFVFTIQGLKSYNPSFNRVVVDMGAVRFVTNGADVMSPGIVDADKNISEEDVVWVCDEKNHEPLAVGFALINGETMAQKEKGKAIKIVHYVGDKIWNFSVAKSL